MIISCTPHTYATRNYDLNRHRSFIIPRHSTLIVRQWRATPTRIITRNYVDSKRAGTLRVCIVSSRRTAARLCSIQLYADRSRISINPLLTDVHKSHSSRVCVQARTVDSPSCGGDWQRRCDHIVRLVLLNDSSYNEQRVQMCGADCRRVAYICKMRSARV